LIITNLTIIVLKIVVNLKMSSQPIRAFHDQNMFNTSSSNNTSQTNINLPNDRV